jgi:hypothetical protein
MKDAKINHDLTKIKQKQFLQEMSLLRLGQATYVVEGAI